MGNTGSFTRNRAARDWTVVVATVMIVLAVPREAAAAFTWAVCDSPFGVAVPVDLGANEADRRWGDSTQYGLNEKHSTFLMMNGNVNTVNFSYAGFNTQFDHDWVSITDVFGEHKFMGNLGSGTTGNMFPIVPAGEHPGLRWDWRSDHSQTRISNPRFTSAWVACKSSPQTTANAGQLGVNSRQEALLIGSSDIIYTKVWQAGFTRMVITAEVIASDDSAPDVDIYASTATTMPDNFTYTWRAYNGNPGPGYDKGGEALDVGIPATGRWLYLGFRSYRGRNHVIIRANVQKSASGLREITVCHPNVPIIQYHSNWPKIRDTLKYTSLRTFNATHGNIFINKFRMKYASNNGGGPFCEGIAGCDWCMTDPTWTDPCGYQGRCPSCPCPPPYDCLPNCTGCRTRIPNAACAGGTAPGDYDFAPALSLTLLHEVGHVLFRLTGPPQGNEEYDGRSTGIGFCAHSVMNGPQNGAKRFCTFLDHCKDMGPPLPGFDCSPGANMWQRLATGPTASWFWSFPSQSALGPTGQLWAQGYKNFWHGEHVQFSFE